MEGSNFKYSPDGTTFQVCEKVNDERNFVLSNPQWKRDNLLQALCKANGTQGGTIHQFVNVRSEYYDKFVSEFNFFCVEMSFRCETRKAFHKLAARVNFEGLLFPNKNLKNGKLLQD